MALLAVGWIGLFLAVYAFFVGTPFGQELSDRAYMGRPDLADGLAARVNGMVVISTSTLALMGIAIVGIGLLQRRFIAGLITFSAFAAAVLAGQLIKQAVPQMGGGIGYESSVAWFPSGHATIAIGFALSLTLIAALPWRPLVASVATAWACLVVSGAFTAGAHRPEDVIGGIALATAFLAVGAALVARLGVVATPPRTAWLVPVAGALTALVAAITAGVGQPAADPDHSPHVFAVETAPTWEYAMAQGLIIGAALTAMLTFAWLLRDVVARRKT